MIDFKIEKYILQLSDLDNIEVTVIFLGLALLMVKNS